jgi:SulP family sulfate permease
MRSYLEVQREQVVNSLRGLSPSRKTLRNDLLAGFTFAAVNVPQGLAYAIMAGITPINGLYTLMFATPVAALFTGSVLMNVSSTGALSASMADTLMAYPPAERLAALGMLTLLIGVVHILLGFLRLGWIMRYVPNSVMVGFITGVAVNIILGQLSDLTGYDSPANNRVMQLADTLLHPGLFVPGAVAIGVGTIVAILLLERTPLKTVAIIGALVITSAIAYFFNVPGVPIVRDITEVPRALPRPSMPDWSLALQLVVPAISVGLVALVQGAGVGQSFPNPDGRYGNLNRDFVGQGLANVVTGFFQGLPAGGSASGTGVLVGAGARSRWANIFAGICVLLIVLLLGPLVELIAMPALAGLLMVIGVRMINTGNIDAIWQTGRVARIAGLLTFAGTLMMPLQYAVLLGVAFSILNNLIQQGETARLIELVWSDTQFPIEQPAPAALPSNAITSLSVVGSLFFAAAAKVENELPDVGAARNAVLILRMRGQEEVGSTWLGVLYRYAKRMHEGDNLLILTGVGEAMARQIRQTGLLNVIGVENVYLADPRVGYALSLAYADAVKWLRARGVTVTRPDALPEATRPTGDEAHHPAPPSPDEPAPDPDALLPLLEEIAPKEDER